MRKKNLVAVAATALAMMLAMSAPVMAQEVDFDEDELLHLGYYYPYLGYEIDYDLDDNDFDEFDFDDFDRNDRQENRQDRREDRQDDRNNNGGNGNNNGGNGNNNPRR
jgi:hypothetical protein